jgi:tetratricopeptide (TPR) repeat protein
MRYRYIRAVAAAWLVALAPPVAYADGPRTGGEPWYQQSTADARQQAQALFAQAVDKHQQLLRGDAMGLYEQALALWDNPDIRWNLALVLEDLGQYLRAYQQLDSALRWDAALGTERLHEVQDRLRALETQRLARLEADSKEPGAEIKLDGQPWFRGAGTQSTLVSPGEHYLSASKPGYFPVTRSVSVMAGQKARAAFSMDADRLIETRRWSSRTPWVMVAAGVALAAVGVGLERQAFAHQNAAAHALTDGCGVLTCKPTPSPDIYKHVVTENRLAIGAVTVGSTAVAVGLALAWLNQPRAHRTEARPPSPIELGPIVSPDRVGVSALVRF